MKLKYLCVALMFFPFFGFTQTTVEGDWTGQLSFGGNSLDLNFMIYRDQGQYKSTLSVPAQSLMDYQSTQTALVDSLLTIEIKPLGIKYQGQWKKTDTIVGNFVQNGMSLKLNLIRGNTKLKRPQEPLPPYPYEVEQITFENKSAGIQLSGTLSLPKKEGRFPAVILISGSGPQDRNSYIMGHKPFLLLAHELTQQGIAVLRFDERGVGRSEGDFQKASLDDFLEDVKSGFKYLQNRDEIDTKNIGLLGHSLGGIIAPRLATSEDVAFLVLLAAPGVDGNQLMLKQRADFLELRGMTATQIKKSNEMYSATYDYILSTDAAGEELETGLMQFYKENYADVMMEKELMALIEQLTTKELLGLIRNRPSSYLSMVKCPVLAIGGTRDFQVSSSENLEALKLEIENGGNTQVEVHEFEGLNHLLQESETGDISEYGVIEQTMSPKVLELIKSWMIGISSN